MGSIISWLRKVLRLDGDAAEASLTTKMFQSCDLGDIGLENISTYDKHKEDISAASSPILDGAVRKRAEGDSRAKVITAKSVDVMIRDSNSLEVQS